MRKLFQLIVFTCAPLLSTAQTQVFTIIKQKTFTQLNSKSDTIIFTDYKKTDRRTSERTVSLNGVDYKFIVKDTRHVKLKEIVDASGNKIASEFLNGDNQKNVLLADGRQLTWQHHRKAGFDYYLAGEVAVKSFYYQEDKTNKFVVQRMDSTLSSEVLPAIAMEHWIKNTPGVYSKRSVGVMLGVATMLAVMRTALDQD
jgi:hypothetical protein